MMGLPVSSAGMLSLLLLPAIFLMTLRIMGATSDFTDLLFRLVVAEGISLFLSLIIVLQIKGKARIQNIQT